MIYGNTGAGLVDINIPQNPLYQQSIPNLKEVSAAAWGLPSLDDITTPDITTEKDIQTNTDLTDQYFQLAQKLKDYAIKGRSIGIDVTKPKNNPTHLQYAQEWNNMYGDFMQIGKELKNAKQNIAQYNKFATNPNTIVGAPKKGEVMTDDYLSNISIETPFQNAKMLKSGYQKLKPIYDKSTFDAFTKKWLGDMDMIDKEAELLKSNKPELADQIDAYASTVKAEMFPPMFDSLSRDKLAQAYRMHKDNLGVKQFNAQTSRERLNYTKSQQELTEGKFAEAVKQLLNTPDTEIDGSFGEMVYDEALGKEHFVPHKTRTTTTENLSKYGVKEVGGVPVSKLPKGEKYIVVDEVKIDGGDKTIAKKVYPVTEAGVTSFQAKYQFPYKRQEDVAKQTLGTYDFGVSEDGYYDIVPNQTEAKVSTKTTQTSSSGASNSTTKKTSTAKVYTIINPQTGKVVANGVSKQDADKAIAKGYKVK